MNILERPAHSVGEDLLTASPSPRWSVCGCVKKQSCAQKMLAVRFVSRSKKVRIDADKDGRRVSTPSSDDVPDPSPDGAGVSSFYPPIRRINCEQDHTDENGLK